MLFLKSRENEKNKKQVLGIIAPKIIGYLKKQNPKGEYEAKISPFFTGPDEVYQGVMIYDKTRGIIVPTMVAGVFHNFRTNETVMETKYTHLLPPGTLEELLKDINIV